MDRAQSFRDRSPENRATIFLEDLRNGKCALVDSIYAYALKNHRISEWRLENRSDDRDHIQLYYKLTKYGVIEPEYRLTGDGLIELARNEGSWTVVNYSNYF